VAESSDATRRFSDLTGWEDDDHAAALAVFRNTCMDFERTGLAGALRHCRDGADARTFFELFFRPVLIGGDQRALFTGYFEPELDGSRTRTGGFATRSTAFPPRSETADG
jgi:membrane-bound lytic murein transglycosylase A